MGELYIDHEYWITFVQLAMAMFAMGATLHVHDFQAVIRLPRSFLTGLVAQMVAVPLVTYLLLRSFDLDPGLAIGLAILAAVPGGTVSNVFTYAGRGDVPLSIALTAVTSLACVVTVPVVLEWLVGSHVPPTFSLPRGRIALEIVATLLVPLAVGMVVLRRWPSRAEGLSRGAMAVTSIGRRSPVGCSPTRPTWRRSRPSAIRRSTPSSTTICNGSRPTIPTRSSCSTWRSCSDPGSGAISHRVVRMARSSW